MTITAPIILRHYSLEDQTEENLSYVLLKGETVLIQTDDKAWQMRIGDGIHSIQELIDDDIGLVQTYIPSIHIEAAELDKMVESILTCNNTEIQGISSYEYFTNLARVMMMVKNFRIDV